MSAEGPFCDELPPREGAVCMDEGWSLFPQWATLSLPDNSRAYRTLRPVYLPTVELDRTEVTNEDYAQFLAETGGSAPSCGEGMEGLWCAGCEAFREFAMESGWEGDEIVPGREKNPVLCVTKDEAERYCEWAGGRLPTYLEWFKAFTGEFPAAPSYPWGEELDLERFSLRQIQYGADDGLMTIDVGSFPSGASATGVLDLAGSVSEYVEGCPDELTISSAPWVRPDVRGCESGSLIAGSNWLTISAVNASVLHVSAGALFALTERGVGFVGESDHVLDDVQIFGILLNAPEGRSWRVGFRCAYR